MRTGEFALEGNVFLVIGTKLPITPENAKKWRFFKPGGKGKASSQNGYLKNTANFSTLCAKVGYR